MPLTYIKDILGKLSLNGMGGYGERGQSEMANDIAMFPKLNMNPKPNLEPGAGTSASDEPIHAVTIEGWGSW